MDFFSHQDQARKQTGKLIGLFALAVVGIIAAIYTVVIATFNIADASTGNGGGGGAGWWHPQILMVCAAGTLMVVGAGSLYKTAQLRAGGRVVAEQLGGRPVHPNTHDDLERRLMNVVEEIAIASGTPVPGVYVMDGEEGINAFAAGITPSDAVIGVTRGCMQQLDRDELQGVIAHEFSHILNGDMRLNIRLMGVLHGILCLALAGYLILRSGAGFRSRGGKNNAGGILALAVALIAVGYIGMFFARLIQAAVSRQREFLADASAVQYTRNPKGISGALKKIGGYISGSQVENAQAAATSHMFFGNAVSKAMLGALATHPPLEERIRRIDQSFTTEQKSTRGSGRRHAAAAGFAGASVTPNRLVGQTGRPTPAHLEHSSQLLHTLPLSMSVAVHEPFSARALVYALLLHHDSAVRRTQLEALKDMVDHRTLHETVQLAGQVTELDRGSYLSVIDLALPALREMSHAQFLQFSGSVRRLVKADQTTDLFEFVLQKVLLRHLGAHFEKPRRTRVAFRSAAQLTAECRVLLSALAWAGSSDEDEVEAAYTAGAVSLPCGDDMGDLLAVRECSIGALDQALDRVAKAAPQVLQAVLRACAETVAHDGVLRPSEIEVMRAICDVFDCPMPPVLSKTRTAVAG